MDPVSERGEAKTLYISRYSLGTIAGFAAELDGYAVRMMKVLSERNFAIYAMGNTISWLGMWMQRLAIGWLSWDLSQSPLWVGLISLAQYVPLIVAGPLFGVLLDHSDRRRYALAVNGVLMALAFGLYAAAAFDALSIWHLFGLCCLLGIANSAYQPVRLAMVTDVVPRPLLTQAISVNSMLFNTTRLAGPALGGIAIAALGVKAAFALNAVSYAAGLVSLMMLHLAPTPRKPGGLDVFGQLAAGIRYSLERPDIREGMVGLWGVVNVAGPSVGGALIGSLTHFADLADVCAASGLLCAVLSAAAMRRSSLADARTVTQCPRSGA